MTNHEIVKKLIGEIRPVGESHIDNGRLENLENMCVLVKNLVLDISDIAYLNKDHHQHSIKEAVRKANDFIDQLQKILK